jgi:stage II sporulation protein P
VRRELNARYANLCRPVYVKKSTYNQQYAPSSLLLEIGSSGNTLEEALRAATLVAEQLAQMLE